MEVVNQYRDLSDFTKPLYDDLLTSLHDPLVFCALMLLSIPPTLTGLHNSIQAD